MSFEDITTININTDYVNWVPVSHITNLSGATNNILVKNPSGGISVSSINLSGDTISNVAEGGDLRIYSDALIDVSTSTGIKLPNNQVDTFPIAAFDTCYNSGSITVNIKDTTDASINTTAQMQITRVGPMVYSYIAPFNCAPLKGALADLQVGYVFPAQLKPLNDITQFVPTTTLSGVYVNNSVITYVGGSSTLQLTTLSGGFSLSGAYSFEGCTVVWPAFQS